MQKDRIPRSLHDEGTGSGNLSSRSKRRFVSAQDVAKLAGVSRSAVSRTFTPGASVSDLTRQKVMIAAVQLGYQVNHLARGLISQKSDIVCVVASDIETPFRAGVLHHLCIALQNSGKVPLLIITDIVSGDVESSLFRIMQYRADATVILSGTPPREILDGCLSNGQRVISINRDETLEGIDHIKFDNINAAEQAFLKFMAAGCRSPVLINSERGTPALMERERAFIAIARKHNIDVPAYHLGNTLYENGFILGKQLLGGSDRPDCAFCVNDLMALGFMDAARSEYDIKIPEELAIIGFDDIEQAGWRAYELSTFRQNPITLANAVLKILENDSELKSSGSKIVLNAEMIVRKSVSLN